MDIKGYINHFILQTRDYGLGMPPLHRQEFFSAIALFFTNRRCRVHAVGGDMNHVHRFGWIMWNVKMKYIQP